MIVERSDGGFQMQATGDGHPDHFIAEGQSHAPELCDAVGVTARGETDEQFAADVEDVAALRHAGKSHEFELTKRLERGGQARSFKAARFDAKRKNDREFIENKGGILDEHGIRQTGLGGKTDDADAQIAEKFFVGVVLGLRFGKVNWLTRDEAEFAICERRAHSARDGGKHGREM